MRPAPSRFCARPATGEKDQQGDVGFLSITSTPWADVLIDDKPLARHALDRLPVRWGHAG